MRCQIPHSASTTSAGMETDIAASAITTPGPASACRGLPGAFHNGYIHARAGSPTAVAARRSSKSPRNTLSRGFAAMWRGVPARRRSSGVTAILPSSRIIQQGFGPGAAAMPVSCQGNRALKTLARVLSIVLPFVLRLRCEPERAYEIPSPGEPGATGIARHFMHCQGSRGSSMPGYLAGRRRGHYPDVQCRSFTRAPAPCRVTRQIQTQRPLRRIEVLDTKSAIFATLARTIGVHRCASAAFCFGFPVHNGAVRRCGDELLDEFRPRHLKAVYYPRPGATALKSGSLIHAAPTAASSAPGSDRRRSLIHHSPAIFFISIALQLGPRVQHPLCEPHRRGQRDDTAARISRAVPGSIIGRSSSSSAISGGMLALHRARGALGSRRRRCTSRRDLARARGGAVLRYALADPSVADRVARRVPWPCWRRCDDRARHLRSAVGNRRGHLSNCLSAELMTTAVSSGSGLRTPDVRGRDRLRARRACDRLLEVILYRAADEALRRHFTVLAGAPAADPSAARRPAACAAASWAWRRSRSSSARSKRRRRSAITSSGAGRVMWVSKAPLPSNRAAISPRRNASGDLGRRGARRSGTAIGKTRASSASLTL